MVFIYTKHKSVRLEYVCNQLFQEILGADYIVSDDKELFLEHRGSCINYTSEPLQKGIQIIPYGLLSETGVHKIDSLNESSWDHLFCFFANEGQIIPFDLFSATFYLLTLYEEHFPEQLDEHLRFNHKESMAYKNGFLEIPLIDRWAYKLKDALLQSTSDKQAFKPRKYKSVSTFDIDHPYLYRNKGNLKNMVGALRDLAQGKFSSLWERFCVLSHFKTDPYLKVLYWIDSFQRSINRNYYLFILIAQYGRYGRTTIYPQRRYYNYLKSLKGVNLGLHPSYSTLVNYKKTKEEKKQLERILEQEIVASRQHFLRMQSPETFRILNKLGFMEDFTLSYAKAPGFRSSTAIPYYFYDIKAEAITKLQIRPTVVMDSCLISHMGLSPEEASLKMKKLAWECKLSGGDFLMLWHNNNLAGDPKRNPWINVFIEAYKYALSLENNNFGTD